MKVTLTAMKAPWPAGARVGDVVELEGLRLLPAWAVGKCSPADDDATATHAWTPLAPPAEPEAPRDLAAELATAVERAEKLEADLIDAAGAAEASDLARHAAEQKVSKLAGDLEAANGAVERAHAMCEALTAERDDLLAKLTAPAGPDRAALEAEAKDLGVSFNARTSDETLSARIAEAKAAKG